MSFLLNFHESSQFFLKIFKRLFLQHFQHLPCSLDFFMKLIDFSKVLAFLDILQVLLRFFNSSKSSRFPFYKSSRFSWSLIKHQLLHQYLPKDVFVLPRFFFESSYHCLKFTESPNFFLQFSKTSRFLFNFFQKLPCFFDSSPKTLAFS